MHLIYKINFPNNKVYIGQTNNLKKRILEHLGEARRGADSKIYRAIRKYNISKDDFEEIESNIETQELADLREIYWIEFYDSYNNGYNSTKGGDVGNGGMLGEKNPRAILNNEEVLQIRLLKSEMKYSKSDIYNKYKDKISMGEFHKIWNYDVYTEVGKELNTEEVVNFYKHFKVSGSKNSNCMFAEQDIINIRNAYFIDVISSKEISEIYNCSTSTISKIISNKTYNDIPMPEPSFLYKRVNHIFTKSEINDFINDFINSKETIKSYWVSITSDSSNLFGGYCESQFRKFVNKELQNRGYEYKARNKWEFEIIKIN